MAATIYRCRKCNRTVRIELVGTRVHVGYGRHEVRYRAADGRDHYDDTQCCGRQMVGNLLRATLRPEIKCAAKCVHAVGFTCDCSCGGKNHATGGGLFTGLQLAEAA